MRSREIQKRPRARTQSKGEIQRRSRAEARRRGGIQNMGLTQRAPRASRKAIQCAGLTLASVNGTLTNHSQQLTTWRGKDSPARTHSSSPFSAPQRLRARYSISLLNFDFPGLISPLPIPVGRGSVRRVRLRGCRARGGSRIPSGRGGAWT